MFPDVSQQQDKSSTSANADGSSGLTGSSGSTGSGYGSGYGSNAANTDDLGLPDVPPNSVEPVRNFSSSN